MIFLESIILAAGYCSRFNFEDNSYKKYMLPFERSNILDYIIIAMHSAGIDKVNIVVDDMVDVSNIIKKFNKFINKIEIEPPEINFIENFNPERENGYSLFLGVQNITTDRFILSMADHVFSDNIYLQLIKNYNNQEIILATDPMKIEGIYDLDDCTKVYGNNLHIEKIGKNIKEYNRLDMGVFLMKSKPIRNISKKIEIEKNSFGVSDIILSAISLNLNVAYLDFPNTIWLDIDTDEEYNKLHNIFYEKSEFRPFNLNLVRK